MLTCTTSLASSITLFFLYLCIRNEKGNLHHNRFYQFWAGHTWYFLTGIAYYTISAINRRFVCPKFRQIISQTAQQPVFWFLHSQFQRRKIHSFACQNHCNHIHLGGDTLFYYLYFIRKIDSANSTRSDCRCGKRTYIIL